MSEQELQFCRGFLDCERTNDCDYFERAGGLDFDDCQRLLQESGGAGRRGLSRSLEVLTSKATLIFIVMALLVPFVFVAIYTNFSFTWTKKKEPKK